MKRSVVILSLILDLCWVILWILSFLTDNPDWDIISAVTLLLAVILRIAVYRCPHCGRSFTPKIFGPTAGHCRHCGKLVEYSE